MSDAAYNNLKVSREGIVLIKSFEGFRPRAIQRTEGGWIIGYGHTLSAREGATVSEADAELLLRYDLLPVEKSVNTTVPTSLNQHQFDALVSFAFSVGVDRFARSDVVQRLTAGAPGEAADAIMGWPEAALPDAALRRRAAERALFVANPFTPVALADLLAAPLPPPPVASVPAPEQAVDQIEETITESDATLDGATDAAIADIVEADGAEPVSENPVAEQTTDVEIEAEPVEIAATTEADDATDAPAQAVLVEEVVSAIEPEVAETATESLSTVDSRGAAVAALLGERAERLVQSDPVIPVFGTSQDADESPLIEPQPTSDTLVEPMAVEDAGSIDPTDIQGDVVAPDTTQPDELDPASVPALELVSNGEGTTEASDPLVVTDRDTSAGKAEASLAAEDVNLDEPVLLIEPTPEEVDGSFASTGPGFDARHTDQSTARFLPYSTPMIGPLPGTSTSGTAWLKRAETPTATVPSTAAEQDLSAETNAVAVTAPESEAIVAEAPVYTGVGQPVEVEVEVEPLIYRPTAEFASAETFDAPIVDDLVLTPLGNGVEPAMSRPAWSEDERHANDGSDGNLFGEDLTLAHGGSILRSDIDTQAPARFDWKETGPFIFMGGVGLVSFGASMAAFRRAAEHSGSSDLTIIGWVLALIGLGCVGVSSVNLYRKFGLPGAD